MKKFLLLCAALISTTVMASDESITDEFTGLHIEVLKTGYTTKHALENGVSKASLEGWGLQAGYELNGSHDFVASISRQDGTLDENAEHDLRLDGNVYTLAWNAGYTFNVVPKVLTLKPYSILGWSWLDASADGKNEAFSHKENSYIYGIGLKANVLDDLTIGAEWSRGEFYGSDMDTVSIMAGYKF